MYKYLIYLVIFIFLNKYLYFLAIKIKGLISKNIDFEESVVEDSTFFISLPTNDYKLYTSLPKDFKIVYDLENFLFPRFKGIKVYYKNKNEKKLVFYMKINLNDYKNNKIISKYIAKDYQRELKQEVCKKLRERNTKT